MTSAELYVAVLAAVGAVYVVGMTAALYFAVRYRIPLLGAPAPRPIPLPREGEQG